MTPEQKELKAEAFRAFLEDKNVLVQFGHADIPSHFHQKKANEIGVAYWTSDYAFIRLAPTLPTEIPYHNPEGVTQEQLEPEKGYRFLLTEEISPHNKRRFCAYWSGDGWTDDVNSVGAFKSWTYRTKAPLPAKYQHLVPESDEERAKRLLKALPVPREYGNEWVFLGKGVYEKMPFARYAVLRPRSKNWELGHEDAYCAGDTDCFYARARKLPTDQERAEAALNAYKLEPGERLVHRGRGWKSDRPCSFVCYIPFTNHIGRQNDSHTVGNPGTYYAEILKEPEMVPFTMETFPLQAWFRPISAEEMFRPWACNKKYALFERWEIRYEELIEKYEYSTDGTTWTKCVRTEGGAA